MRLVDRQRPINVTDIVVPGSVSARCNDIARSINCALRCTCIRERTTQHSTVLAMHKPAVANTIPATVGFAIVCLRCIVRRDLERSLGYRTNRTTHSAWQTIVFQFCRAFSTVVTACEAYRNGLTGTRIGGVIGSCCLRNTGIFSRYKTVQKIVSGGKRRSIGTIIDLADSPGQTPGYDRQRCFRNSQRPINVTDIVVSGSVSARCNDIARSINCALRCTCIRERTTQHSTVLAMHKPAVANTIPATVGFAIVCLRCIVRRDLERSLGYRHR